MIISAADCNDFVIFDKNFDVHDFAHVVADFEFNLAFERALRNFRADSEFLDGIFAGVRFSLTLAALINFVAEKLIDTVDVFGIVIEFALAVEVNLFNFEIHLFSGSREVVNQALLEFFGEHRLNRHGNFNRNAIHNFICLQKIFNGKIPPRIIPEIFAFGNKNLQAVLIFFSAFDILPAS